MIHRPLMGETVLIGHYVPKKRLSDAGIVERSYGYPKFTPTQIHMLALKIYMVSAERTRS
jgi:hypothetical protein